MYFHVPAEKQDRFSFLINKFIGKLGNNSLERISQYKMDE
jgi:hypothetical protein